MKNDKKRIFVADDEKEIREILNLLLSSNGYEVVMAEDGNDVIRMMSKEIDLYILDINMPDVSGVVAAFEIRKYYQTPIIFLTAFSGETDKMVGFSVGGDDYIVKPFLNTEVMMRIKAVLRRFQAFSVQEESVSPENCRMIYDALLDLGRQVIVRNGEIINLTYTEFKILELLTANRKKVMSMEAIYRYVWEYDAVGDRAIMVHIKNIRKKLGDDSKNPIYLKTAWGRGYYVD